MSKPEANIYVVEDDPSIRFGLEEVLKMSGYQVISCDNGGEAISGINEALPDLILLDVMLPGKSGYDIAKELRASGCRIPVLMLTAKGEEMDKVVGLNSGADDYVTKPFGINELLARIQALLRRTQDWSGGKEATPSAGAPISIGNASINPTTYEVSVGGETVSLTPKELELLLFLDRHRGSVLSRDQILEEVWGVKYFGTTRTLDQCIAQVRKKIGDGGRTPEFLQTVHGVGYKLL